MNGNQLNRRSIVYKNKTLRSRFPRWLIALIAGVIVTGIILGVGLFYLERRVSERFDILVVGGLVVDGTGAPAKRETVGIRGGKIVPVKWPYFAEADKIIDARGLTVAPGFIDVHTHIEGNVSGARKDSPLLAPNFIAQGITTIITGNCGRSAQSLSQFFGQLKSQGVEINIGSLVGHNTIRRQVMGESSAEPTGDELRRMCQLVARAMQDGALGLSTGLEYTPGTFADQKEIQALAVIAAHYRGIYATHMRDEGNGMVKSLEEAIAVGREANIPVEISHLKWRGRINWGRGQRLLDMLTKAQNAGLNVKCDIYPYTASSTTLDLLIPKAAREGGAVKLRERLRDADGRRRVIAGVLNLMKDEGWQDFAFARVANCDFAPEYNGRTIPEVTALLRSRKGLTAVSEEPEQDAGLLKVKQSRPEEKKAAGKSDDRVRQNRQVIGKPSEKKADARQRESAPEQKSTSIKYTTAESQAETVCYLASRGSVQMIYENMSEDDVAGFLQFPNCMLGSDSGIRNGEGRPHPRGYGSAPRLISLFVLKRGILTLEEAVRRMTSLPAETFGIPERGKLLSGYWADLVIFDPATIKDEATYDDPFRGPEGIAYVIVNGHLALDGGQVASTNSGQVIKREP
jgi:N-acyl-D-amino-acid deacylase